MESYQNFANVYDVFMEDVPYDKWFAYIENIFSRYRLTPTTICELGCGTGKMTTLFAKKGYDVIGLDLSAEMLMIAQDTAYEEDVEILYTLQDMASFEIGYPVDIICSCCDSMNYLTEENDILSCFKQVKSQLNPNGLFIFDMNTKYKYKDVLGNNIFADQKEDAAYIWTNYFDEEDGINEYEVSFFIKNDDETYERSIENHYQREYSVEKIKKLLDEAGLRMLQVNEDYSNKALSSNSERMTIIASHIL